MADGAHESSPDEPRPGERPEGVGASGDRPAAGGEPAAGGDSTAGGEPAAGAGWPPPPGRPADDNPAAADQPTPQQPIGPWELPGSGEQQGSWQRPSQWERPAEGGEQPTGVWREGAAPTGAGAPQDPWWGEDETAIRPVPGDETQALPPTDPNATAVVPGLGEPRDPSGRWSARAGVPPGAPSGPDPQWAVVEETRGGMWWMPVLIGIVILILLALLGLGLWLALHDNGGHQNPAPVPPPSPTLSVPSPMPSPTPPPTAPVSSAPAPVSMPALRGLDLQEAQAVLGGLGLTATVQPQFDDSLPLGTVLGTQPGAGSAVQPGSQVILFVNTPPRSPASPSPALSPVLPTASPS